MRGTAVGCGVVGPTVGVDGALTTRNDVHGQREEESDRGRSAVWPRALAHLFRFGSLAFDRDPLTLGCPGWSGLLPRLGNVRRLLEERDQPFLCVAPVLVLGSEPRRFDDNLAPLIETLAGERARAGPYR